MDNTTFTLRYVNGTYCHRSQQHRSTVITLLCDRQADGAEGPSFVTETDDCEYSFFWRTRAACSSVEHGEGKLFRMVDFPIIPVFSFPLILPLTTP